MARVGQDAPKKAVKKAAKNGATKKNGAVKKTAPKPEPQVTENREPQVDSLTPSLQPSCTKGFQDGLVQVVTPPFSPSALILRKRSGDRIDGLHQSSRIF